jgi:nitroreductase
MEVIEAIKNRRSIRNYTDQPVAKEVINELLDLAAWAPSATNKQTWGFLVIDDKNYLLELSHRIKKDLLGNIDSSPQLKSYQKMLENESYRIFHNAPVLVAIYGNAADSEWYIKDCCLAAQNLMLAAHDKGLGTCWIGFSEKLLNTPEFKQKHNIPSDYQLVAPLILGYPVKVPSHGLPRKEYPVFK